MKFRHQNLFLHLVQHETTFSYLFKVDSNQPCNYESSKSKHLHNWKSYENRNFVVYDENENAAWTYGNQRRVYQLGLRWGLNGHLCGLIKHPKAIELMAVTKFDDSDPRKDRPRRSNALPKPHLTPTAPLFAKNLANTQSSCTWFIQARNCVKY